MQNKNPLTITFLAGALAFSQAQYANLSANEVIDWNQNFLQAAHVANSSPLATVRLSAIVQTAVFDALNGIERRYTPIHVTAEAPHGASRRAAVIQAAYGALVKIFPVQKDTFDAQRSTSLSAIGSSEDSVSVTRGIDWGQSVADEVFAWRATDGITPAPPPYLGGTDPGEWRPTPPDYLPGAAPQFDTMTTWVIESQNQFRPPGPPAMDTAAYAADLNETESLGSISSSTRTDDQTLFANFWAASTVSYFWDRTATALASERNLNLSDTARLLALVNVAMADAGIACWDGKYTYSTWRPITAINLADTDGNDATEADPTWTPLLVTPNHPEYPSGHSTTSGAAGAVLAAFFGDQTSFTVDSDAAAMAGVTRSFSSFTAALEEIANARICAGIHFRTACVDGDATGAAVANYVMQNAAQPIHGQKTGHLSD